jgi:predicted Zn finger-like uncharacterized protein
MLITTCTQCGARFRVTPSQLNAKQGQVRCGRCRTVFNGFQSLERHPDDDTGSRLLAARLAAEQAAAAAPAEIVGGIETLGPAVSAPGAEPVPEPAPRPRQAAARPGAPELTLTPPSQPRPPSRAWWLAAAALLLVLAAEVAYGQRSVLAQRYPVLRPWLESMCEVARCAVSWGRDETLLKLEDSELLEVPGKPSEIALTTRVRNLASVPQDYPFLELTLSDLTGQAAVRRVLRPADYLGRAPRPGEALAAGAEIIVQLRLETPRVKATGYELLVFYP